MTSNVPNIKIKRLDKELELPKYHNEHDAAMDLRAAKNIILHPNKKEIIPTGIAMAIPTGYVGLIWDRSGLAAKHSLTCMAGVIDAGYRGEIGIVMINHGDSLYEIKKNDRIAQILIQPVSTPSIEEVDELDNTSRGEDGFGSTGKE